MTFPIVALQQVDPLFTFLASYGWIGIAVAWMLKELWPMLKERFSAAAKRKAEKEEEDRALRLAREEEDRRLRIQREEQWTQALQSFDKRMGQIGDQLQTFGTAMTATAERLSSIERDHNAMREALAILADRKQQQQRARGNAG